MESVTHSLRSLALAALFFGVIPASLLAQAGSGELTGAVRDPSGALVPAARVSLTQKDTNQTFNSATSSAGIYLFSSLKPGFYALTIDAAGFKHFLRQSIRVATAERLRVDVALELGSAAENITITSDAPLL